MNFTELQDRLKFVLNFNDTQTSTPFAAARYKQAINFVYEDEVNKAQAEGGRRFFKTSRDITWPASQLTLILPEPLDQRGLIRVTDVTTTDPGYRLIFDENGLVGDIHWKNRNTLQWGTAGPSSARTLRVDYFAKAVPMTENDDVPELIPEQFHELLVWAAAIWLRIVADESAPNAWTGKLYDLRLDFHKYISRGRPMDDVPVVNNTYPDSDVGLVY